MKKSVVIGLMGHSFHCMNLGVGALAISESAILDKIARELDIDIKIICFEAGKGDNDYHTAAKTEAELDYYTYSPAMIKKFKRCDLIIDATGGDSFSDIYGAKLYYVGIFLKIYALLSGRPVILAPQTIGPFAKKGNEVIANAYMRFVKRIFLRDEVSVKCLSKTNRRKSENTADMAFRLPYCRSERFKGKVGFNVSGLLYDEKNHILKDSAVDYPLLCSKIIEMLLEKGREVVLISHVIVDETTITDNDYCASLRLKEKYPQIEIAPVYKNPIEAKDDISGLDFFIGSRMHAVIAAASSGVPAVSIAYSRKFAGVFEPLGYDAILDATTMGTEEILEQVTFYVEHSGELKEKVRHTYENADKRLENYEAYLKQEVEKIVHRGAV